MVLIFRCVSPSCDGQTYLNIEFNQERSGGQRLASFRTITCPLCSTTLRGEQVKTERDSPFAEENEDGKG